MAKKLTDIEQKVIVALEALDHGDNGTDIEWIARAAKVSPSDARIALSRLMVLGLVSKPPISTSLSEIDQILTEANAVPDTPSRVLLASILMDTSDEETIVNLGLPAEDVRAVGDRLRHSGVWDAGGVCPVDGVEFYLLCNVADGTMTRSWDQDKKEWMYRLTPDGEARVEKLMRPPEEGQ